MTILTDTWRGARETPGAKKASLALYRYVHVHKKLGEQEEVAKQAKYAKDVRERYEKEDFYNFKNCANEEAVCNQIVSIWSGCLTGKMTPDFLKEPSLTKLEDVMKLDGKLAALRAIEDGKPGPEAYYGRYLDDT